MDFYIEGSHGVTWLVGCHYKYGSSHVVSRSVDTAESGLGAAGVYITADRSRVAMVDLTFEDFRCSFAYTIVSWG